MARGEPARYGCDVADESEPRRDPERGLRIRQLREARPGLTKAMLAAEIGASPRSLLNWENGNPITTGYVIALADALGTTPTYIWSGPSDPDVYQGTGVPPSGSATATIVRVEAMVREQFQLLCSHDEHTTRAIGEVEVRDQRIETHLEALSQVLEELVLEMRAMNRRFGLSPALEDASPSAPASPRKQGNLAIARPAGD
jgi:DNA-binding XRE family transcriptional regulator